MTTDIDRVDSDSDSDRDSDSDVTDRPSEPSGSARVRFSVAGSTLAWFSAVVVLAMVCGVLAWKMIGYRQDVQSRQMVDADIARAEQVATDYATGASTIDFADFQSWVTRLQSTTTPELAEKFDATAPKLQEILTPLRWTSTSTPIAARCARNADGTFVVNVFLTVDSTSAQRPEGASTTVTYTVTVDKNDNWSVTDVGGIDDALGVK